MEQLHIVLRIASPSVGVVVHVASGSHEVIFTPVGTNHGGGSVIEVKHALQFAFVILLTLALHIVAQLIVARCHIVDVAIIVGVFDEVKQQRVAREFILCSGFPSPSLAANVVSRATLLALHRLWAIGTLPRVSPTGIKRELVAEIVGEALVHHI